MDLSQFRGVHSRVRGFAVPVAAVLLALLLISFFLPGIVAGRGKGKAPSYSSGSAVALAKKLTAGKGMADAMGATREALALGGVATWNGKAYAVAAAAPAASSRAIPEEVAVLALEEHQRATAGRLTLAQYGDMLRDFGDYGPGLGIAAIKRSGITGKLGGASACSQRLRLPTTNTGYSAGPPAALGQKGTFLHAERPFLPQLRRYAATLTSAPNRVSTLDKRRPSYKRYTQYHGTRRSALGTRKGRSISSIGEECPN